MSKLEDLQKEIDEQCRINGMGAQRELRLKTDLNNAIFYLKHIQEHTSCAWTEEYARDAMKELEGQKYA